MSTFQRLTLIGLYNYDNSLFDNMTLPEGYDKETLIETLLLEHGEKCVLYTDFDFMKYSFGIISRKWALELQKIYEALTAEYNPIENYDRIEEWKDRNKTKYGKKNDVDFSNETTYGRTDTRTQETDGTTEHKVAAFNESTYAPDNYTTTHDGTIKNEAGGKDTTVIKGKSEGLSGTDKIISRHEGRIHGNIGVMTAASMASEVVDQRLTKNLYGTAARIFANELLIQIY